MIDFLDKIKTQAALNPKKIVFPESTDKRVLKAVDKISQINTTKTILIGDPNTIQENLKNLKIKNPKIEIIDINNSDLINKYSHALLEVRKNKDLDEQTAKNLISQPNYFATIMVHLNEADGMISGATGTTAETIRPALQIIKTKKMFHKVSGFFFMILKNRLLIFSDCAITINPNSHDLADIAEDTALTAKRFDIKPRIAFLSFSTNKSADHPFVDKVREALALFKYKNDDIPAEGEMQVDAALIPEVCTRKFPESKIQGNANILIFPDLQSANIAYKLVERLGGATAIGPILQGLNKPINDLSRGCSVDDIINLAAITSMQAQEE